MSNTLGKNIQLTIFGESHGESVGAVLDGVAAGVPFDTEYLKSQMDKRRAKGKISTQRREGDVVHIQSGVVNNRTTGTPICFQILNTNTKSKDYDMGDLLFRPGHADYTAHIKYNGYEDARGGGHFSGRLTAPVVAAGSLLLSMLQSKNILIGSHILKCAGVEDQPFSDNLLELDEQIKGLNQKDFATLDDKISDEMIKRTEAAADEGDSVGGVLETVITHLPVGLGEPFFDSVESALAHALFSIPAVKGVEFGAGFSFAQLRGSQANDAFYTDGNGNILTKTNNNGGINGGITNGMPIVVRTVIKPTPSIFKEQETVNYTKMSNDTLQIKGRHDPCIIHRARVVQDSICALVISDLLSQFYGANWQNQGKL